MPKPFFRKQTQSWYVQIGKKQTNLGKDRKEAHEKYHQLMTGRQDLTADTSVCTVLLQILQWNKLHRAEGTQEQCKRHVISFAKHVGASLTVSKLKPYHITRWIDSEYVHVSGTYKHLVIRSVQRAFNWAVNEGHLDRSPVARIEKPQKTPRNLIITPEQWGEIVGDLRGKRNGKYLLDILTLMRQTGCRPQEARLAEAKHLDRGSQCLVFEERPNYQYETSKRHIKLQNRIVPLTDMAYEICERCAIDNSKGPMMRTSRGRSWTKDMLKDHLYRMSKKLGFHVFPYAVRHTWATEALTRGVDSITVAQIMGHKNINQLQKTYQHIEKKSEYLRDALHKAVGVLIANRSVGNRPPSHGQRVQPIRNAILAMVDAAGGETGPG